MAPSVFQGELILRDIPGFQGYRAGSDGFIYSYRNRGRGKRVWLERAPKRLNGRVLRGTGYIQVKLMLDGGRCAFVTVHRMVTIAFHGDPPPGHEASHRDGNQRNNTPDNLLWETSRDNTARKWAHGTMAAGYDHALAVLDRARAADVRRLLQSGVGRRDVAGRLGVSYSVVARIAQGKHYGCVET